jgi:hypothetical protein
MTAARRKTTLVIALLALLAVSVLWSYGRYVRAGQRLAKAGQDLAACQLLAARIERIGRQADVAGWEDLQSSELARQVEQACRQASIPSSAIVRIWPEAPQRVGESVYRQQDTRITLKNVTTRQAAAFLYALTEGQSGLWAKSLQLRAQHEQEALDKWTAEAVVSYLVYSPPTKAVGAEADRGM